MNDNNYIKAGNGLRDVMQEMTRRTRATRLAAFAKETGMEIDQDEDAPLPSELEEKFRLWSIKKEEESERVRKNEEEKQKQKEWDDFLSTVPARFRNAEAAQLPLEFKPIYEDLVEGKSGLLYGKNGPGKTHLAWCAAKEWKKKNESFSIEKGLETLSWIKSMIGDGGNITEAVKNRYLKVKHLVIDEIDKIFETSADFVYLTYLIDIRYDWMLQTVLITNRTTTKEIIDNIGQSVYSRLTEEGNVVCGFMNSVDRRRHPDGGGGL